METTIYEVSCKDGSTYRVYCANRSQKQRFQNTADAPNIESVEELTNGIHNISQWEMIVRANNCILTNDHKHGVDQCVTLADIPF